MRLRHRGAGIGPALLAGCLLAGCSSSNEAATPAAAGGAPGTTPAAVTPATDPTPTSAAGSTAPTAASRSPLPILRLPTIAAPPPGGTTAPFPGGSTGSPPGGSAGPKQPEANAPAATGTLGLTGFRTPSGNIHCMLVHGDADGDSARCMIGEADWVAPPKPADCDLDWGSSLSVGTRDGAGFGCYGDTVVDPGNPLLDYGQSSALAGVRCTSRETGVTCTAAATGHGFELSRAAYRLF